MGGEDAEYADESLLLLLLVILVDAILYCFLAIYLDQVVPVGYGAHRNMWYIFEYYYYGYNVSKDTCEEIAETFNAYFGLVLQGAVSEEASGFGTGSDK